MSKKSRLWLSVSFVKEKAVYLIKVKLTKRPKFLDKRQVRNSDVDVFRDGLVLREHGQDDALSGLVENG